MILYGVDMSGFKEKLLELLGPMPQRCDLDPIIESSELLSPDKGPNVTRHRVTYMVEPGDRVPAYLFIPKITRQSKLPAVLAHHQHAGQFNLGKSEVAGLTGNPDQAYALELANRGYVVLAPDALCFEERQSTAESLQGQYGEKFEYTRRIVMGSSLQTKYLSDMQRGFDYLENRPEVDAQRLGSIGHSLGGQQTLFAAALDERVKVGVSSCGFSSLEAIFGINRNHNFALYVPGMLQYGDIGALLAEVSPRPFLSLSGENDAIFPLNGVLDSFKTAQAAYERDQASERLVLETHPGVHEFPRAMRTRAYDFFDRYL